MNIILYQWDAYGELALQRGLESLDLKVIGFRWIVKNQIKDAEFTEAFDHFLAAQQADWVISFNFFPLVAELCKKYNKKYISWIFSSPHFSLYCEIARYEYNYIFCFDRADCLEHRGRGLKNVYHMPLAVDVDLFQKRIEEAEELKQTDLSFVGTLYTDENYYFDQIAYLPERIKGYIDGICEAQLKIYGYNLVHDVVTKELLEELRKYISFNMDEGYELSFEKFIETTIQKRITVLERERLLRGLGGSFHLDLFTGSDTSGFSEPNHIRNRGYIHYYDKMPGVFHHSKINLNISLRSIETGIPLRALDILACGGFLITNYQQEIAECFTNGVHLAMFGSYEELLDQCHFYLEHEEERKAIARAGHELVKEQFSYKSKLREMLKLAAGNELLGELI